MRRSRRAGFPWIGFRKGLQILTLSAFLLFFLGLRAGTIPAGWAEAWMRLDPFAMLSHLLASRSFQTGSLLALVSLVMALLVGRAWCGWLCPLGTILDFLSFRRLRFLRRDTPEGWRKLKYLILIMGLALALGSGLTLMILDPLTLLLRALGVSILPALDQGFMAVERFLYSYPALQPAVSAMDSFLRSSVFPYENMLYR